MDCNVFKQMLIFGILNIVLISYAYGKDGQCYRKVKQGNIYSNEVYCCINYELKNGTCIECKKGYVSEDGGICTSCDENYYGDKCGHFCRCKDNQKCNHISGCIDLQYTRTQSTVKDITILYSSTSTPGTEIGDRETTEPNHDTGLFNQTIVMYSVCIGGILAVLTICYVCLNRLRSKTTKQTHQCHKHQHTIKNGPTVDSPIQKNIIVLESIYDEVDDISLLNHNLLPRAHEIISDEPSSTVYSEGEHECMKNEDYLNPYQIIVTDYEKHDYNTVTEHCITIDEEGNGQKGNEENAMNMNEYLNVVDPRCENLIGDYNTSSTLSGYSGLVCRQTQGGEIVEIENKDHETPDLNLELQNEDIMKKGEKNKLSHPVLTKQFTI